MRHAHIMLAVSLVVVFPLSTRAQPQPRTRLARLRAQVAGDDSASLTRVRLTAAPDRRALHRALSLGGGRPNLRLFPLRRCREIDRGGWRGREVVAAFAGARRACELVPPRPHAEGRQWYRLRWGTDDDDFKAEAVGFVVLDSRRGHAWVVEYHWAWFDR